MGRLIRPLLALHLIITKGAEVLRILFNAMPYEFLNKKQETEHLQSQEVVGKMMNIFIPSITDRMYFDHMLYMIKSAIANCYQLGGHVEGSYKHGIAAFISLVGFRVPSWKKKKEFDILLC